ncbi:MAG: hypothetical protein AB1451_03615, partial [Nitrospirota bacterium]
NQRLSIPSTVTQRIRELKSRMRESRTSGSVGDPGGNTRVYPTIFSFEGTDGSSKHRFPER